MSKTAYSILILTVLGVLFTGFSTYSQAPQIIYDGRFDFTWEYYSGHELLDTARICRPLKNKSFRNRSASFTSGIKEGDQVTAINGVSLLRSEKDSSEIYGLEEGAASRRFLFEVYRKSMDTVLKIPVMKESDISGKYPLLYVDYFADSSGTLTLNEIQKDSVQDLFVNHVEFREMIYSAYQGSRCTWFRVHIESRLSTDRPYLLIFSGTGTDTISVYSQTPVGEWITQYAGMVFPEDLRGYVYKDWAAVKLNLSNKGIYTIYVRVCSEDLDHLRNTYLQSLEYVQENDLKERTTFSLLAGMMILILLLCILIYFITRVRSYLLFFLIVTGYFILAVTRSGYLGELDHMLPYAITRDFFYLVHILPVTFFLWFGIHYIEIGNRYTRWHKLIVATLGLMVFSAAILTLGDLFFNDPGTSNKLAIIVKINKITSNYLPYLVLLAPSLRRIRKRDRRGWFVLLACLFFIVLAISQDLIYPGNSVKSLVFGLNTIEQGITLMNTVESVGIIVMFFIFAIGPYRS